MTHSRRPLADAAPALAAGLGTAFAAGLGTASAPEARSLASVSPVETSAVPPSRYVRHAILDARAGLPVMLFLGVGVLPPAGLAPALADTATPAAPSLVMLPAETATDAGLTAFRAAIAGEPVLVLAPSRAAALLGRPMAGEAPVALRIPPTWLTPDHLQALADPTRPQTGAPGPITLEAANVPPLAEAAIQLAKLGRLLPAVLVGHATPGHGLITVPAADVLSHQADAVSTLHRVAEAVVPLAEAPDARLIAYRPADGGVEHVALLIGRPEDAAAPLVRIHSECFTGDILGSLRCDCGPQLHQAIQRMTAEGSGVLLYMAQEGRGIGLVNKLRAYALQDRGLDTLDANRALGWGADERSFAAAAMMLGDLGVLRVRLLTNNPDKVAALEAAGIAVAGRLRHAIAANGVNDGYLETKARRFGHLLG